MALSANAIGFYLEAEDVSLSKTLKSATTNYEKYTKALEEYNDRAFKSTQTGLGKVQELLKSVQDLPAAVEKSMKTASGKIAKQLKPITQKVDLQVTVKSATKLKRLFSQAVSEAMAGANIRMSAALPQKRLGMFQQGVGLRAQYGNIPQPPDMRGKIKPLKKFNTGGVVEGPAGIDKVLALLTKDEMVLPADVSKELQEAAGGRLKSAGGKFASAKELSKIVAEVTNLADALDMMKGGLEAGLGGEDEQAQYVKGVEELGRKIGMLTEAQDDLSFTTQVRLGPAILQATSRLEDFEDQGEKTGTRMEKLLGKILGPARFLAIAKGVESLQEGFGSLRAGAGSAFSTLGGDEIGSGIDSINQMNQFLGVSRDELLEIKIRAGKVAKEIDGLTFDELGFALKEAAELGIKDQDIMFNLATTAGLAAKGLNIAAESAVKLGFELTQSLNMSQAGLDATIATMGQLSDKTSGFNIDASKLFAQTNADVLILNSSLRSMSEEESQKLIGSFNQIGAVLESQFIGAAGIRETLAKAFEGGSENQEAIKNAFLLTGLAQDELKAKLKSGDMAGLFEKIGDQVAGLDTASLKELSTRMGIGTDELGKFGAKQDEINAGFEMSKTRMVETGKGMEVLTARADNNRSAFEKLKETFTDWVSGFNMFGINGAEVLDMFKEFNLTALVSVAILGKPFLKVLGKAGGKIREVAMSSKLGGRMMSSMGGIAGKLGPMLGKLAMTAGPILLVGAALAALTNLAIGSIEKTNDINKETAEKGAKLGLTEFGAVGLDINKKKKSIKNVQTQIDIDRAAGQEISPAAINLLERYNGQLAVLEEKSQSMFDAANGGPKTPALPNISDLTSDFAAPLTPDEIASFQGGDFNMSTGATENKLDRNNELMEQLVSLARQQLSQGGGAAPTTPGSPRGGGIGASIAGGDL